MNRRAKAVTALALAVALAAGLYAWRQGDGPGIGVVAGQSLPRPTPQSAPPAARSANAVGLHSKPLPPAEAPLSLVAGSLQSRADAGDRKAACRLGIELVRCQQVTLMSESPAWARLMPAEGGDPVQDAQRAATQRVLEQCQALPAPLLAQGVRYLRQAALAGEPEAMIRYANGEHFPLDARGLFAGPQFDTWRQEAPALLQRAFDNGVPEAAVLMSFAYADDHGLLSALIEDDPAKASALMALMVPLHGWSDRPLMNRRLDAASLVRARAQAETWHRQLFDGRRYRGRSMLQMAAWPKADGSPHDFCRDP